METMVFTQFENGYHKTVINNYHTNPDAVIMTDNKNLTNNELANISGITPNEVVIYETIRFGVKSKTKKYDYYIYKNYSHE